MSAVHTPTTRGINDRQTLDNCKCNVILSKLNTSEIEYNNHLGYLFLLPTLKKLK